MPDRPTESSTATAAAPRRPARRKGGPPRGVTVVGKEWLSPDMVRVYFTGSSLADFPELIYTDHYVKIFFPPAGADYSWPFDIDELQQTLPRELWPVTRTYTIRSFDPATRRLAIDFVVHGDSGLAGPWAVNAEVGDQLGFRGPGGAYAPEPGYDTHLLVGDEAALPAVAAALDRLPDGSRALVFVEVADADHHQPLPAADRSEVVWVHRGERPYGEPLAEAVRERGLPSGTFQTFVHGNAQMIRDLRRFLFVENKVERRQVSISGYWRTGQNEDAWQSGKHEFMAGVEAEEQAALAG